MNNFQANREAVNNIRQGFEQAQELQTKVQAEGNKDNVTEINLSENRKMTNEEKDENMLLMASAINELTERLNKLEGSGE